MLHGAGLLPTWAEAAVLALGPVAPGGRAIPCAVGEGAVSS